MVSDNTYLHDKKTIHGPKLGELETVLRELVIDGGEKVVIFTQWLRMAELIVEVLKRNKIGFVQLHGGIPSKDRRRVIARFREDPACRVFLSTDAGGVGLNLQSGSVVINVDIPWNPAVLEQRIGRVHRMGQKKPVRVINFITSGSIEHRILELLQFKKSVFAGALDENGNDVVMVGESQLGKLMKTVEAMTSDLPRQNAQAEQQREQEDAAAARMDKTESAASETTTAPSALEGRDSSSMPLDELLQTGARFLASLGEALSAPGESIEKRIENVIGRDSATGNTYLKIPLPEPQQIKTLFSALGELFSRAASAHKNRD